MADFGELQYPSSGRYRGLSKRIGASAQDSAASNSGGVLVVSVHARTILFLCFALFVGLGLLKVVPALSAASGVLSGARTGNQENAQGVPVSDTDSGDPSQPSANIVPGSDGTNSDVPSAEVAGELAVGGISPIFTREVRFWESKILEWSEQSNLDPDIVATIMQIESCGDPGAASHAGAQGLFQVMPFHFDPSEDMLDPDTNARRGLAFYNRQLEYTGWDIYLSFAGYNGGYAASGSSYPYWANETQRYYTWAKGIYDDAKAGLAESPTLQQWLQAGGGGGCHRAAERLGL